MKGFETEANGNSEMAYKNNRFVFHFQRPKQIETRLEDLPKAYRSVSECLNSPFYSCVLRIQAFERK